MKTKKTMRRISLLLALALVLTLAMASPMTAQSTLTVSKWTEHASNPVFDPTTAKAYYPTIVYDASQFSSHGDTAYYKMWFGSDSGVGYAYSDDGISWTEGTNPVTGLVNANHPLVEYYSGGFPGANSGSNPSSSTMYYRIWYWPGLISYSINDIRYAESADGTTWYNDQPLQNGAVSIISGGSGEWNRGSYGPADVLYNPGASNTGTDWKFSMYYDGTTGGNESIGLGFSADGITWTGYDAGVDGKADPVLEGSGSGWDQNYVSRATVIKLGSSDYRMWFSGGTGSMNHGIGYATSSDGISWAKDANNPIFHKNDGVSWRAERTYCPMVIQQGGIWKMWFSGKDAGGNYAIGYATNANIDADYSSIQVAVNAASAGDTINVAAGTYYEDLDISTAGLSLVGAGTGSTVIDYTGQPGHNNAGIYISAANVTVEGFTLTGDGVSSTPRYGLKIGTVDGVTVDSVTIADSYRTGLDTLGASNLTIDQVTLTDNGGHGIQLLDVNGAQVSNITTSGSGWQAVSVATWGHYSTLGTSGIVVSGTNSFGGVFQLEEGDYNNPGVAPSGDAIITYSTNPADGADVTVQASDFGYALHGDQDDGPDQNRVWFFKTLAEAQAAAASAPIGHLLASGIYIESLTDRTQLYISPGCEIQAAIDAASSGDTINVAAGTYDETVNIEGFTGLTINGADKTTVIVKPTSTLDHNACGYGSNRTSVFRVVDSTNITLQNMTMDFDLVKANFVHGIFFCDSTGSVHNNVLKNLTLPDASGGYYEIGSDFRGPGFTHANPAEITISDNTFIDTGRLGVVTHDYVDATITGNTFYKTTDDFGYAIEIGGPSVGTITNNTVYGFDTPALSDGSESAGIYIEPAWTTAITSPLTKNVLVENNEVYDSQYGMWIGNGYDGFAGDVDIVVTLNNNSFHDNVDGAAWIQDEDKENGSSVTVTGGGNSLTNNGACGYKIYTEGDGDITVDLSGETITGHDTGVYVEDTGSPSTSSYSVTIDSSNISGNTTYGINNTVISFTVDAEKNWWGSADGPGPVGTGSGDNVSTNVDYSPWCLNSACTATGTTNADGDLVVDDTVDADGIQDLIYEVSSGTTIVLPDITYTPAGGFTISTSGITIELSDGTVIQATSPCFTVIADNTTITSATFGGGKCIPTGGSHGIQTGQAVSNLVINGVEIDGTGQSTGDGIHIGHDVTNLQIINNYIHDLDGNGIKYEAVTLSGVHDVQGNLFQLNTGDGINNQTGSSFDVEYNSWDDIGGPTTGDGITGIDPADYTPWTHVALSMTSSGSPVADKVGEGYQITYTIKIDASEVSGADFDLNFDQTKLQVVSVSNSGTFQQQISCGLTYDNVTGVVSFCGNSNTAQSGSGLDVFKVVFEGLAAGVVPLNLDETDDKFSMAPPGGASNHIYASALTDGSVTVYDATTVTGRIDLQGRADDTGAVMEFGTGSSQGYGPFTFSTSSYWGSISASDVVHDTGYAITVTMARYLDVTTASSKTVDITTDNQVLSTLVLLGGDVAPIGAVDNQIDIGDASVIGSQYGTAGPDGDVNDDGTVDILDLALVGGNYNKSSNAAAGWPYSFAYGGWTP